MAHLGIEVLHCSKPTFGRASATMMPHRLDQVFEARHRGQPPFASGAASTACPSVVSQSRPAGSR